VLGVEVEQIEVRLLREGARPPRRTHSGDAGYDLACCDDFELEPGESAKVPTGFALALPDGIVGLVCPRSGLAATHQVTVVNGPGVVDANFRGECCVLLINLGQERFVAKAGDRIAQLVLVPNWTPDVKLVAELPSSADDRGEGGFGSSGR
jgi:dUTP pyrophosphatase